MKFHLRVVSTNSTHVHCALFANGDNVGHLTMYDDEYLALGQTLLLGGLQNVDVDVYADSITFPTPEGDTTGAVHYE
ncbi:MAG TPA: hypothetical protein VM537_03780 [Anaerolineae bacterium]|nr:hypothetical protein [Anaerolineae bacterium]